MTAFVLSVGAQCLVGQEMTTAQMACCAATDHDCGAAAATEDCCQSERAQQEQLLTQAQHLVPPLALVSSTIPALVPLLNTYTFTFVDTTALKAASPPKYILLASFLI